MTAVEKRNLLKAGSHPLVRLAIVLVALLVGLTLVKRGRQDPAKPDRDIASAVAVSHRATSRAPAVAEAEQSSAKRDQVRPASPRSVTVPPHQQSDVASLLLSPARLQAIYGRGQTAMRQAADRDQQVAGARLIYIAAALGYPPARALITREYPHSPAIRAAVPAPDAVRFSLDAVSGSGNASARTFMVLMTAYFAGHDELATYSKYLLDALSDDRGLQSDDTITFLLYELSRVSGVCVAVARTIVRVRTATGPACSAQLRLQIKSYLNRSAPSGVAARSKRQALEMLASRGNNGRD